LQFVDFNKLFTQLTVEVTNKLTNTGQRLVGCTESRVWASVPVFGQLHCGLSRCSKFETTTGNPLEGEDEDARLYCAQSWRWRHNGQSKRQDCSTSLHNVISRKNGTCSITTIGTWNIARDLSFIFFSWCCCCCCFFVVVEMLNLRKIQCEN